MQMRIFPSTLCAALTLAGCAHLEAPVSNPSTVSEFVYDERDAIPNPNLLPKPGVNQLPVVGNKKMLVTNIHWSDGDGINKALNEKFTLSNDPGSLRSYITAASGGKLNLSGQVIEFTSGPRPDYAKVVHLCPLLWPNPKL